jgi:hypothetical protein
MATTQIDVTVLTALAGVGQVTLTIGTNIQSCLPYLGLDAIEIWASATNDRAAATKVGETTSYQYVHSGLAASTTRYYWARARNKAGTLGAYYPVSATAGVAATTLTTAPGPNSVGNGELQDGAVSQTKIANAAIGTAQIQNLAVTSAKIDSLSANKIDAGTISATISILGPTITGGLFQTSSGSTRVEMSGSGNNFAVYSGGDQKVFIGTSGVTPTASFTGYSLVAVQATGLGTTSGHGLRASASGGGSGLVGVSAGGGGYGVYNESGGYGPFTGAHDGLLAKASEIALGDIVCDLRVIARGGIDDTVTEVAAADGLGRKNVVGVLARRVVFDPEGHLSGLPLGVNDSQPTFLKQYLASKFDRVTINSVGEGQINVCGRGGDFEVGDLIVSSSLAGKGERQTDDILRSSTVAKIREAVTFDTPDQVKRVACIYLCG